MTTYECHGISVKIIAHSISPSGQMIVTWELEYQRFIHAELMTHRLFSRNAASSRAIPVAAIIDQLRNNPAMPIHWGKNQSGMQAKEVLEGTDLRAVQEYWKEAGYYAVATAEQMSFIGLHKQVANRILEPFQTMKTVMTATCMDNFFWLRNHEDAQPEIKELARLMWEALNGDHWIAHLKPGQWHTPYFMDGCWTPGHESEHGYTLEQALAISSSCCAQVSYRKLDDTLEKALMVYGRLVESEPVHASPFEHQASPMNWVYGHQWMEHVRSGIDALYEEGATHLDKNGNFWSGNFKGWIQHRQLIPNNVKMEGIV